MTALIGEAVAPLSNLPYIQKPLPLLETAFSLYGFLPEDNDSRWEFLTRYQDVHQSAEFSRMNFANAWSATYLSDVGSFRSGYVTTQNPENCTQLKRALDNLSSINVVIGRYASSHTNFDRFDMRHVLTDRITNDPMAPRQEVTPCPEALHQVRLYEDDKYLARVGFNVHQEAAGSVLSVVNIQGTPGGIKRNGAFAEAHGISPFNVLVRRVIALAEVASPEYEVRGLINPERGNPQLYWGVLTEEGVPMYHALRSGH